MPEGYIHYKNRVISSCLCQYLYPHRNEGQAYPTRLDTDRLSIAVCDTNRILASPIVSMAHRVLSRIRFLLVPRLLNLASCVSRAFKTLWQPFRTIPKRSLLASLSERWPTKAFTSQRAACSDATSLESSVKSSGESRHALYTCHAKLGRAIQSLALRPKLILVRLQTTQDRMYISAKFDSQQSCTAVSKFPLRPSDLPSPLTNSKRFTPPSLILFW